MGGMEFGAPLPSNFGLGKGLPGLAKYLLTLLGDLAVAPLEGLMTGALNSFESGAGGLGSPFGMMGIPAGPVSLAAADFSGGGVEGPVARGGGGGGGTPSSGGGPSQWWGGKARGGTGIPGMDAMPWAQYPGRADYKASVRAVRNRRGGWRPAL